MKREIRDQLGTLICMEYTDTGMIEIKYRKEHYMEYSIFPGYPVRFRRGNRLTTVSRTEAGVIAYTIYTEEKAE